MERLFPMFVKLTGRRVLVVGAGAVGEAKVGSLLDTGAHIRVVALQANTAMREWAGAGAISLEERAFARGDLDGIFLVVAATSSRETNGFIFTEAQRRQILCNVVDVPELCDFFYPAVVRRGDLQIAVSTSGQSPSLAQRIRKQLEQQFGSDYANWVEELGKIRREVLGSDLPAEGKRELLHSLTGQDKAHFTADGGSRAENEEEQS
jgi:precorrin-2 dehydrogenase / sirohydrochlorin ferrochelatase